MTQQKNNPWRNWKKDPPKWDVEKEGNFKLILAIKRPYRGPKNMWWIEGIHVWLSDGELKFTDVAHPPIWWRYLLELPPKFKDSGILKHPDY